MPYQNIGILNCAAFKTESKRWDFNPIALRKAKIVYNFGLSECNRVEIVLHLNVKYEANQSC